jgi:hypothetical protein
VVFVSDKEGSLDRENAYDLETLHGVVSSCHWRCQGLKCSDGLVMRQSLQVQTLYEEQESLLNSHMNAIQVKNRALRCSQHEVMLTS